VWCGGEEIYVPVAIVWRRAEQGQISLRALGRLACLVLCMYVLYCNCTCIRQATYILRTYAASVRRVTGTDHVVIFVLTKRGRGVLCVSGLKASIRHHLSHGVFVGCNSTVQLI
jgi:hypothetical protein